MNTPLRRERRFPVDLDTADRDIRALYEDAKAARWIPEALPWSTFDASAYEVDALAAARRVWSRRAWIEYTGIAETPALLIRFCLELDREADPKFFLTVRNTEEAWHLECFHRLSEACGGYVDAPADAAWHAVFNRSLHRDALDAKRGLDAYVLTRCAFADGFECALTRAWLCDARDPVVRAVLEHCLADRERHARFGLLYAARRAERMTAAERDAATAALVAYVDGVVFSGYDCVALASSIDTTGDRRDLAHVAEAGLGAVDADAEVAVFADWCATARTALAEFGLRLPPLVHPRLGAF